MKPWLRDVFGKVGLAEYLVPAFKFQCEMCGETIAAPVPEPGTAIKIKCRCGTEHGMIWMGRFWKYQNPASEKEYVPPPFASKTDEQIAEEGLEALRQSRKG